MIYEDVKKYAETVKISEEKAEIICRYYLDIQQRIHEASRCPECGEYTLTLGGGEFCELMGSRISDDYVMCLNDKALFSDEVVDDNGNVSIETYEDACEFESDVTAEYELLHDWMDFDALLGTVDLVMTDEERNAIADRMILNFEKGHK